MPLAHLAQRRSPRPRVAGFGCPARAFRSARRSLISEGSADAESRSLWIPSCCIFTPASCLKICASTRDLVVRAMLKFWSTPIYILRSAPKIRRLLASCTQKGRLGGKTASSDGSLHRDRRGRFGGQFPCQSHGGMPSPLVTGLSTGDRLDGQISLCLYEKTRPRKEWPP